MNTLKSALIAAFIAFAGPALADGGAAIAYFPNLTFPAQDVAVTQNKAKVLAQSGDTAPCWNVKLGFNRMLAVPSLNQCW